MSVAFLLVTCCLERSRVDVLSHVIASLNEQVPELKHHMTVFDNASTEPETLQLLSDYDNVYQSDRNVGYWTAIDWWLKQLAENPPEFTYIVESDMIHYNFNGLWTAANYLTKHADVGSVRLHEYSIAGRHLYNKDRPLPESRRNLWQSHVNKVTNQPIAFTQAEEPEFKSIWCTNFLTQLPALNRFSMMQQTFAELARLDRFSELDFQRFCHDQFQTNAILDGGIFHCNLNHHGTKAVTGSWTAESELKKIGYRATRQANIEPADQYTVKKLDMMTLRCQNT